MQIVVRQLSGLGNQLFQYAAGRYYARRYDASLRLALDPVADPRSHGQYPRPFLLSHFAIAQPMAAPTRWERAVLSRRRSTKPLTDALRRSIGVQIIEENVEQRYHFLQDLALDPGVRTVYLEGYWQTWRTAAAVEAELRAEYALRTPASEATVRVMQQIAASRDSVSLHVRRGDYTLAVEGNRALPMTYYANAISLMKERLNEPIFFVFSDDIAYTRANLPIGIRAIFVDHNKDATAFDDLRLMACCRHHIIANSSFSWWGAWLNPDVDKIVVAPKFWYLTPDSNYPDLLPPEWITLSF